MMAQNILFFMSEWVYICLKIVMCKLESPEMKSTVDPRLPGHHVSSRSDYPNYEMTVLIKYFAVSVRSITVFEWGPNISVI